MKKSLLNSAISIAMSSALLSASVLNTQAYAGELSSFEQNPASITDINDATVKTYMYPGMGVGAATGTLVAGPVGFLVGGLVGAVIGANQEVTHDAETEAGNVASAAQETKTEEEEIKLTDSSPNKNIENRAFSDTAEQNTAKQAVQLAQIGPINSVMQNADGLQQEKLINILTTDLSLDVYFRSGSSDIETFYPARLAAIANLVNNIATLEVHLDGYSDRRGNKAQNIALANDRIKKVREQLINAGVEENRINSNAFGEMRMVSTAGDLEAYTYDRKVVIRFERTSADSIQYMTTALSNLDTEETTASENKENTGPVIADASTRF